tara:strand:- start:265 stop:411 length:147 start_codon:yes stop_codon:yes gene_type:complete
MKRAKEDGCTHHWILVNVRHFLRGRRCQWVVMLELQFTLAHVGVAAVY